MLITAVVSTFGSGMFIAYGSDSSSVGTGFNPDRLDKMSLGQVLLLSPVIISANVPY
jgi:hypothetical protein